MANLSKIRLRGILHTIVDSYARDKINTLETSVNSISDDVITNTNNIGSLTTRIGNDETSLGGRITANENNITTINGKITTDEAKITKLAGTVLYNGSVSANYGASFSLSDSIQNYKYVEVYYQANPDESSGHYRSGQCKCSKAVVGSSDTIVGCDFIEYVYMVYQYGQTAIRFIGTTASVYGCCRGVLQNQSSSLNSATQSDILIKRVVGYKEV